MNEPEFDLTEIERGTTYIVRLPKGRMIEIEWLISYVNTLRFIGFSKESHYFADEEYRMAGLEPLLRDFRGDIPMSDY